MADHQQLLVKSALESIGSALSLLESLSAIPPADAALIRSRLPGSTTNPSSVHSPGGSLIDLGQSNGAGGGSSSSSSPYPAPIYGQNPPQHGGAGAYRAPPPLPNRTGGLYEARAAWDYEASAADDLPFRKGDLICVTEEPNNDWHKGFVTSNPSRVGLFPATYVVRQPRNEPPPQPYSSSPAPSFQQSNYGNEKQAQAYQPQGYGHQQQQQHQQYQHQPPYGAPPQQMVPYQQQYQPPPQHVVQHQPPPPQEVVHAPPPEKKPSKFDGMGRLLASSAVGGVGWGAGSAVGSGLINKIF